MIACPKCGADNMIGAIFCRSCGAKLNLDELQPEMFTRKGDSFATKLGFILWRLLMLALLFLLVGVLVGLFIPAKGMIEGTTGDKELAAVMGKYHWMRRTPRQYVEFTFTSAEATALANRVLGLQPDTAPAPAAAATTPAQPTAETSGALVPQRISIEFMPGGKTRLMLDSALFDKLDVTSTLLGRFEVAGGSVIFRTEAAWMGRVPLPKPAHAVVIQRFAVLVDGHAELLNLEKSTRALEIGENSVRISLTSR